MKKKSNTILNILIVLLLGIMAFSGYKLFEIQKAAKEIAEQYEKLEQTIQKTEEENDYQLSASEKYQSVYEVNNNFVGWVYIPDTPLNYPVLQTKDYPEYYLRRDFYKKYSFAGVRLWILNVRRTKATILFCIVIICWMGLCSVL